MNIRFGVLQLRTKPLLLAVSAGIGLLLVVGAASSGETTASVTYQEILKLTAQL